MLVVTNSNNIVPVLERNRTSCRIESNQIKSNQIMLAAAASASSRIRLALQHQLLLLSTVCLFLFSQQQGPSVFSFSFADAFQSSSTTATTTTTGTIGSIPFRRRGSIAAATTVTAARYLSLQPSPPASSRHFYDSDNNNNNRRSSRNDRIFRLFGSVTTSLSSSSSAAANNNNNSNSNFLSVLWRFTRPHTIIGSALAIPALHLLAAPSYRDALTVRSVCSMVYAMIPSLLMNLYITGLNQITDVDIDKINKPDLPIAAGDLSVRNATLTVVLSLILSIVFASAGGGGVLFAATSGGTNIFATEGLNVALGLSAVLGTLYSLPPFRLK